MREIKFRAWVRNTYFYPCSDGVERDHIEHKMIDSFTMREDASVIFEPMSAITWDKPRYTWDEKDKRKIISVMQYTGLKDKNGDKDLYEYDIIDSDGNLVGNIYENDKKETDFIIQGFGTKDWIATYKEAMDRGCKNAE